MKKIIHWLDSHKDIGIFLLRVFVALRLIYGVIDNVFSWDRMIEFRDFLAANGFPYPLLLAIVSVYAQLIAGLLILTGWKIRVASITMIINFGLALVMVHRNDTIEAMTPALFMLFCSILFLFEGAGRISLENGRKITAI